MDLIGLAILFLLMALISYMLGAIGVAWFPIEMTSFLVWAFIILAVLTLASKFGL